MGYELVSREKKKLSEELGLGMVEGLVRGVILPGTKTKRPSVVGEDGRARAV